jgi:hypothetical protein
MINMEDYFYRFIIFPGFSIIFVLLIWLDYKVLIALQSNTQTFMHLCIDLNNNDQYTNNSCKYLNKIFIEIFLLLMIIIVNGNIWFIWPSIKYLWYNFFINVWNILFKQ